jgi:hypothetical protein
MSLNLRFTFTFFSQLRLQFPPEHSTLIRRLLPLSSALTATAAANPPPPKKKALPKKYLQPAENIVHVHSVGVDSSTSKTPLLNHQKLDDRIDFILCYLIT